MHSNKKKKKKIKWEYVKQLLSNLPTIYRSNMHLCMRQVKPSAFHFWLVTRNTFWFAPRQPVSTIDTFFLLQNVPQFIQNTAVLLLSNDVNPYKQNVTLLSLCFCLIESLTFKRSLQGLQAIEQELMCSGIHHHSLLLGNSVKKNR